MVHQYMPRIFHGSLKNLLPPSYISNVPSLRQFQHNKSLYNRNQVHVSREQDIPLDQVQFLQDFDLLKMFHRKYALLSKTSMFITVFKVSKYGVFLVHIFPYFPTFRTFPPHFRHISHIPPFSANTGKYRPEKTPYLDNLNIYRKKESGNRKLSQ